MKKRKHGMSYSSEYMTWDQMKRRCFNKNRYAYERYGGRGITVCDEWKDSFEAFFKDMGPRPSPEHSIDRIDNDKGYYKENCRWATMKEQSNNRHSNHLITYQGETHTINQWASQVGISQITLRSRILNGWSIERALTEPTRVRETATYNGETKTLAQWAEEYGIDYSTLHRRIHLNWDIERALKTPKREPRPRKVA